jgi:hypothetical protein
MLQCEPVSVNGPVAFWPARVAPAHLRAGNNALTLNLMSSLRQDFREDGGIETNHSRCVACPFHTKITEEEHE